MRTLHPVLVPWLTHFNDAVERSVAAGFKATPTNAREWLAGCTRLYVTNIPVVPCVQDDLVPAPEYRVPIRIYHPSPQEDLPVLVYFHGGGHMCGSITVYDPICRKIALAAKHIVVSADYRLAPENPYPAGLHDALGVVHNLWPVLDSRGIRHTRQLSLGGDSGGGTLAASVAGIVQHEPGIRIKRQFLIYPSLDYTLSLPSVEENAVGFLLEKDKVIWYFENYFQHGENWKEASPLFWEFTSRLPESLIITAEFCPLRDEGRLYAQKLRNAGIRVEELKFDTMIHAFLNMENLVPEACGRLYSAIGAFLQRP